MTWGTWVLLSQKSQTIWSYIWGEKFKKRHFSTVFSSYSWFQLKLPGISAYTTLADIEKNLSSYAAFLIGRKPLGVHWELGCQMFWDCWKVQRRNINRLKHKKNNVCSLRLPAHTRDNRILKERRGKGKHEQALTRCQSKAAAFTLTMKKSHRDLNPFSFPTAALEQRHPISPTATHTLPVPSNIMGWQFLFEFHSHFSTCPPSMMLCWVVFAFGAPTRRNVLQEKEETKQTPKAQML